MICYICGRTVSDDAVICPGCGAQLRKPERVKREPAGDLLRRQISPEKSRWTVGGLLGALALAVVFILGIGAAFPYIESYIGDIISSQKAEISPAVDSSASEISEVSGEILVLNSKISDCVVQSEKAYDDGSWEKVFLVNGEIVIKTLRYELNEDWINTHIYALYPDVQNVSAISPAPSYSDASALRIRFSDTSYAEGCTVEVVLLKTEKFDHIFIVEMPDEYFEDYLVWINEWIDSLTVVDAVSASDFI